MSTSTKTVTLRVTPRHRSRLDILISYFDVNTSKFFADYIDEMWTKACQNGELPKWLNDVSGVTQDEKPDEQPTAKQKSVKM